jgi:UDP-N-acetylmuramoylalanine--D-glutamate ligase
MAPSLDTLTSWHSDWSGLRVVVVGLDATGFAVVDTLVELGAEVAALAPEAHDDVVRIAEVIGASVLVSSDDQARVAAALDHRADLAVVSPEITCDDAVAVALVEAGVPVWSDVDFAWRVRDKSDVVAQWVLVVGETDGPRIADLAARILVADGHMARHVGLGSAPLLDALRDPEPYTTLVVSAGSAGLGWWQRYPETLRRPFLTVSLGDGAEDPTGTRFDATTNACIYRRSVGPTEDMVKDADVLEGARAIGVGLDSPGMSDLGLVEGILCDRAFLEDRAHQAFEISTTEELQEAGWAIPDDLPAVLAAIAIARSFDVPPALIAGVVTLP